MVSTTCTRICIADAPQTDFYKVVSLKRSVRRHLYTVQFMDGASSVWMEPPAFCKSYSFPSKFSKAGKSSG